MAKASKNSPAKEGAKMAERPPRARLFEYASLPKWEMAMYWTFQIVRISPQAYLILPTLGNVRLTMVLDLRGESQLL